MSRKDKFIKRKHDQRPLVLGVGGKDWQQMDIFDGNVPKLEDCDGHTSR